MGLSFTKPRHLLALSAAANVTAWTAWLSACSHLTEDLFAERAFLLGGIHFTEDEIRLKIRTNTAPEWKKRWVS